MDLGSEPLTEGEKADLEGIAAIKESAAHEYKEGGNQFVKMDRKHDTIKYSAAREYTKAITQMGALSIPNPDGSVLFANHCRALDDAEQAIRLAPSNIKLGALPGREGRSCSQLVARGGVLLPDGARVGGSQEISCEQFHQRAKVKHVVYTAKDLTTALERRS